MVRRAMGGKGELWSLGRFERAGTRFGPAAARFGVDEDRALDHEGGRLMTRSRPSTTEPVTTRGSAG